MIPHTLVLKPGLVVHSIYNGYWFWGRPSVVDLWHDLRAVTQRDPPRLGPQHARAARGLGRGRPLALPRLGPQVRGAVHGTLTAALAATAVGRAGCGVAVIGHAASSYTRTAASLPLRPRTRTATPACGGSCVLPRRTTLYSSGARAPVVDEGAGLQRDAAAVGEQRS